MSNEHFNLIARFYDEAAQFTLDETLLDALELPADGWLLDAGGGTGRVAAALRGYTGGVVVADVSSGMMKYARAKNLACVYTPVERLPFASGTFARVFMLDALHHVHHQAQAAAELFRVLAPGGILLIIEPDIRKFAVKLIALGEKLLLMRSHFLGGEKIAALFADLDAEVTLESRSANVWVKVTKR
jgi:demethylmenaquinone methyltransferase/2-methoxy-6-polyprenyl-1,4-benzoquinol methylase